MVQTSESELMAMLIAKFKVVLPTQRRCVSSSCAEMRVYHNRLLFNKMTAAELRYPEYVCIYISNDTTQIVIQAATKNDVTVPFCRKNADGKLKKGGIYVSNRVLCANIQKNLGWPDKSTHVVPAVRYCENGMLLFDLSKAYIPNRMSKPQSGTEELFQSYPSVSHILNSYTPIVLEEKNEKSAPAQVVDVKYTEL